MSKAVRQQHKSEYNTYRQMKYRCTTPTSVDWSNYGGRGITVCARWLESFENFMDDMGPRPEGLTLDRVDNDKGYSPDNCEWRTYSQQNLNTRPQATRHISTEYGVGVYQRCATSWHARCKVWINGKPKTMFISAHPSYDEAAKARIRWVNYCNYIRGTDPRQYPYHNTTPTTGDIS